MAISGNKCVDECPPSSFEITSEQGRRNCQTIVPPPPGGDICPAESRNNTLAKRTPSLLHARQAADFPLNRFTFNKTTCSTENRAFLSKTFGEALSTLRLMKKDLDDTLKAASADGKLPRSNMVVAFGDLDTRLAAKIRRCMNVILERMDDFAIQMKIEDCQFRGGALGGALAGARVGERSSLHAELSFSKSFFSCSTTEGLNDWRLSLPSTAVLHELSHAYCLTDDRDSKGVPTYYTSKSEWKAFLDRSKPDFLDPRQNADAYRIWAHAVKRYGGFPKFGEDPEGDTKKDEL
ncbi:hypothetical protein HK102_006655 [Quaeritorhiza haematococci]|nr:hypothetical protein HK102_006655 [Quaeritorhiza haematococci]